MTRCDTSPPFQLNDAARHLHQAWSPLGRGQSLFDARRVNISDSGLRHDSTSAVAWTSVHEMTPYRRRTAHHAI